MRGNRPGGAWLVDHTLPIGTMSMVEFTSKLGATSVHQ
jgi:hypothetical protein